MVLDLRKNVRLSPEFARLLNETAQETRVFYNECIEKIAQAQTNKVHFWTSELASRNTFSTDVFFRISQLFFLEKLTKKYKISLVYVDCPVFRKILQKSLPHLPIIYRISAKDKVINFLKPFRNYAEWIVRWTLQVFFAKLTYHLEKKEVPKNPILIDSFVFNHSFSTGTFLDRYYDHFLGFGKEIKSSFCYVPTLLDIHFSNYWHTFKALRQDKTQFLLIEDQMGLYDYLYALFFPFSQKLNKVVIIVGEINIFPLFSQLSRHNKSIQTIAFARYLFFKKLAQNKIKPKSIINWFEGQVIDKAWQLGANTFFQGVPKISYQIAANHEFYLSYYPTDFEYENGVLADKMYVSGKGFLDLMKVFSQKIRVEVAPAFRYAHLYSVRQIFPKNNPFQILVGLSFLLSDCWDILDILQDFDDENTNILLKNHPALTEKHLKNSYQGTWKNWQFVEGNFGELLEKSHLLISTNSSVCLESLALGIPVIIIGSRSGLTQNPIPPTISKKIWDIAYTSEQLAEAINRFFNYSEQEKAELEQIAQEVRENYFEPVTEEGTRAFLGLQ